MLTDSRDRRCNTLWAEVSAITLEWSRGDIGAVGPDGTVLACCSGLRGLHIAQYNKIHERVRKIWQKRPHNDKKKDLWLRDKIIKAETKNSILFTAVPRGTC